MAKPEPYWRDRPEPRSEAEGERVSYEVEPGRWVHRDSIRERDLRLALDLAFDRLDPDPDTETETERAPTAAEWKSAYIKATAAELRAKAETERLREENDELHARHHANAEKLRRAQKERDALENAESLETELRGLSERSSDPNVAAAYGLAADRLRAALDREASE